MTLDSFTWSFWINQTDHHSQNHYNNNNDNKNDNDNDDDNNRTLVKVIERKAFNNFKLGTPDVEVFNIPESCPRMNHCVDNSDKNNNNDDDKGDDKKKKDKKRKKDMKLVQRLQKTLGFVNNNSNRRFKNAFFSVQE